MSATIVTTLPSCDHTAQDHVVDWAIMEAKRGTDAIGFLPRCKYQFLHHRGRLLIVTRDGQPVGFALHGPHFLLTRVTQIWVAENARRIEHGRSLINYLIKKATGKSEALRLRCAEDLAANSFWTALGFAHVGQEKGGARRGRIINLYELRLPTLGQITDVSTGCSTVNLPVL